MSDRTGDPRLMFEAANLGEVECREVRPAATVAAAADRLVHVSGLLRIAKAPPFLELDRQEATHFCRWSSDNWQSDVHCFTRAGKYTTRVALMRFAVPVPGEPSSTELERMSDEEVERLFAVVMRCLQSAHPIGLPDDGATIDDNDVRGMLATVTRLRARGYRVPPWLPALLESQMLKS